MPLLVISHTTVNPYSVDLLYLFLNLTYVMDGLIYEHLQLTSWLHIMTWRFIHVFAYSHSSLSEIAPYGILWTYKCIFIHSGTEEHLSFFQFSVKQKISRNICVCLLFLTLMYSEGPDLVSLLVILCSEFFVFLFVLYHFFFFFFSDFYSNSD